jgi:ketosteroid isomerase-like protein
VIGRQAILAGNKKDQAEHPLMKVISYRPEIKDIQVVDGVAFEWDYFDASFSDSGKGNDVQTFRGKALRILKRQPDGTWKFSRVMWNPAEGQSVPK